MKILFLSPIPDTERKLIKSLTMPQLSLHILAGLTPSKYDIQIVEEEFELVNPDEQCDIVAITSMTASITRAYKLADHFVSRGKTVVMGGIHPTIMPQEALLHCHSVVVGEAEIAWGQFLDDFEKGQVKEIYKSAIPALDKFIPINTRHGSKKRGIGAFPVETSRGCPYTCDFCAVPDFYGRKQRHKPIENVLKDIAGLDKKTVVFIDDNLLGSFSYAEKLFKAITPYKVHWGAQCSITTVEKHPALLKLMAESGCKALFFGLESIANGMDQFNKSLKSLDILEDQIKRIQDSGIHFHASIIFGFDQDDKSIFETTINFLERNHVGSASFQILTPFPGTKLYETMKAEGRIIAKGWEDYRFDNVTFMPKHMTPDELTEGFLWAKEEFSKFSKVFKRYIRNPLHPLVHFGTNLGLKQEAKNMRRELKLKSQGV